MKEDKEALATQSDDMRDALLSSHYAKHV